MINIRTDKGEIMIKDFDELLSKIKKLPNKTIVIAAAQVSSALDASVKAMKENIADCILVGNEKKIYDYLSQHYPEYRKKFDIIDTKNDLKETAYEAVNIAREGIADIIMKGNCPTATLMKSVLDKEKGLRTGDILSDVLVYEHPQRLVLMSDGGINLNPDVEDKVAIIKNAVKVAHSLENSHPKVALLAAVEVVNPKMQSTIDADKITKMNEQGKIKDCIVNGPLAFDNAIDKAAAKAKGIESEVAGDADVLIVPNIEAGNIFGKSLTYYCKYRVAHVLMGARVPILITSRVDSAETKFLTMALGIMSAS